MVAAVSGNLNNVPSAMAAAALREDTWAVRHLDSDVPADLAVIAVTTADVAPTAQRTANQLRSAGGAIPVGGSGRTFDGLQIEARAAVHAEGLLERQNDGRGARARRMCDTNRTPGSLCDESRGVSYAPSESDLWTLPAVWTAPEGLFTPRGSD